MTLIMTKFYQESGENCVGDNLRMWGEDGCSESRKIESKSRR